jgi:hypothetical protein
MDHIRHPGLQDHRTLWWLESGLDAVKLMEYYLTSVHRVFVFGEPYKAPDNGVHNVHVNQGDPASSPFAVENGIWQDGGLLLEYTQPQARLSVMMTKFETQAFKTDASGHPV